VLDGVLSAAECAQLIHIARCCGAVGYRANHCAATIFDIAAVHAPWLLLLVRRRLPAGCRLPLLQNGGGRGGNSARFFSVRVLIIHHSSLRGLHAQVAAREKVRAAAEEALGLPLGLLLEFTGLQSWRPGSSIAWHHDSNRPYLAHRRYAAVAYLNTSSADFRGGTLEFRHGEPREVRAAPGRVVSYGAGVEHCVRPVTAGERFTLTLWFTEDLEHDEDATLLRSLRQGRGGGVPASMYALPDGGDLRLCRLAMLGLGLARWEGEPGADGSTLKLLRSLEGAEGCRLAAVQHTTTFCRRAGAAPEGPATSPAAVLLDGFQPCADHEEAIAFLQRWAWRGRGGAGAEPVCSRHLAEGGDGPHCGWLAEARVGVAAGAAGAELCRAQAEHRERRRRAAVRFDAVKKGWLELGCCC
jgi:hypothetical protein